MNIHNKSLKNTNIIGIDFGGVIISSFNKRGDTQLEKNNFLTIPPQQDAFMKITSIVKKFNQKAFIISKAGDRVELLTRKWLDYNNFFYITNFLENNLIFCNERSEKMPICRELNITHFVDDKIHVMHILKNTVPNLFLFGNKEKNKGARRWTSLCANWAETHDLVLASLDNSIKE